jgi:diguanylate cyclase (GGDEF)-like protein
VRLSITAKIALASLATLSLVLGLVGFLLRAQTELADRMSEMVEKNMTAMRLAEQVKYNFVLYDDLVFRHLFTDDRSLLTERARVRERVVGYMSQMRTAAPGGTVLEILAEVEQEIGRYDEDVRRLLATYSFETEDQKKGVVQLIRSLESPEGAAPASLRRSQRQTLAALSADGRARLTRIYSRCEELVDISRARLEDAQVRVASSVEQTERTVLQAGAAVVAAVALVAFLLARSLLVPVQNLLQGVQRVTAGELQLELPVEGSDEVGRLTHEFNTMTRHLAENQRRLVTETITDPLTELHNLRYFQAHLKDEISRATRYKHPFALLVLDIDHFKHYNDTAGHPMGNVVLKQVAATMREVLRREDFVARYGGEEFVVLLPETDGANARQAAERLRQAVEQSDFPGMQSQPLGRVTVSVGGAVFPRDATVASQLVERADKALYAAKAAGRNRVVWAEDSPPPPEKTS